MNFFRLLRTCFGVLTASLVTLGAASAQTTVFTHDTNGNRTAQTAAVAGEMPALVVQPADQTGKLGGMARFSVVSGGPGPFTYQWFAGASPIAGATGDTLVLSNLQAASFTPNPTAAPKYSVVITNAAGSVTSGAAALYQVSAGFGLPDWWRLRYFGSLDAVNASADADGDGVTNEQEYQDATDPVSSASRRGRLFLRGPAGLVTSFPMLTTYAEGTPVGMRGTSYGELQFGGWTGSLRSPASDFTFDVSAGGDHFLTGLFGSLPVEETAAPPFFARTSSAAASIQNLATAPDGSVVVCGTFERLNGLPRRFVARLRPDGTPDLTFAPAADASVFTAAIQRDGKVVIVGSFTQIDGQARPGVARLLPSGALDSTFNPPSQGTNISQISTVAIQRDGKILVGGAVWTGSGFTALVRLNSDGSRDTAFAPALNGLPSAMAVQRDGRIVLGGGFTEINGTAVPKLVRLLPSGALDSSFSASTTDGVTSQPAAVVVQPDGKILAGGAVQIRLNGSPVALPVIRLLANGTLDTAFTQRVTALTPTPSFRALALQDDGRIVGVGSFTLTKPDVVNAVRLKADGSADTDAFVISRANGPINAVAAQTDRGLVLGGDFVTLTPREGPMNNHRYLLTAGRKTWPNAEAEAQGIGGHLFAIGSQTEQNFVLGTILPSMGFYYETAWLGVSDRGVEGIYAWSNGEPATYANWNGGEPNNGFGTEDAGEIHGLNVNPPGRWNDVTETVLKYGVIEIDPATTVQTSLAWVAGRDLARNERAGAVTELTNPNATVPEWSYGYRATQTSPTRELTPFAAGEHSNSTFINGLEGWLRAPHAYILVNPTNSGIGEPTAVVRPDELLIHPTPTGFTVVRWTAPAAGTYAVSAFWQDANWNGGDGASVGLVRNGTEILFSQDYENAHGPSTSHVLTLATGDTLDFLIGARGTDVFDSARFNAIIKLVPDAASVWVAGRDLATNEKPDGTSQESQNPNPTFPAWSYGSRTTVVTSGLTLYTSGEHLNSFGSGDDAIEGFASGPRGAVGVNTGNMPIAYNYGFGPNIPCYPGEMLFGPAGGGGPYPVVRWTAPESGTYDIFAIWQDSDFHGGNGFSAHLVVNGGQVYGQDIDNAHGASTFQTLTLAAGDQVDFTMGTRGGFEFDTTKFNAVVFGPGSPVAPPSTTLTPVTTRATLFGNATLDWASVAGNNGALPNPFGISASNGAAFRVSKATEGNFTRLTQGNGWFGNFSPGDAVLNHGNSDGPVVIAAADRGGVFSALGAQIMPNQDGPFTATLRAYDVNGALLGTATFNGTGNNAADNSAIFVGVRSDSENIHSVSIDTNTTGFGGDFAINHVSFVSTPRANGDLALSRGGLARVVTTNLLTTGELGVAPSGPVFAANSTVNVLFAPQTSDALLLTVRLERSTDGATYQDVGALASGTGGVWETNPTLPPGTSFFRGVVTDSRQQQRRSFAAGPFITPPAVTSELAANGNVGLAFQYVASATGPLTGFTATGLPAWATASYDPASELLTITGTPSAAGLSTITLAPTNAAGTTSATLALIVSHTFESWRAANFTASELNDPALSGANGDATGGDIDNLLRYALGIPAKRVGMSGLPTSSVETIGGQKYLTLTYTRDLTASGVTLAVQITESLAGGINGWNSGAGYTTEISRVNNGNGTETVVTRDSFPMSASPGRRFMRLRASQ